MASLRNPIQELVRRKIAAAKAARDLSWEELAQLMTRHGMPTNANRLTAKNSRGSFKASEFIVLLRLLGARFIDLSDVDLSAIESAQRTRATPAKQQATRKPQQESS